MVAHCLRFYLICDEHSTSSGFYVNDILFLSQCARQWHFDLMRIWRLRGCGLFQIYLLRFMPINYWYLCAHSLFVYFCKRAWRRKQKELWWWWRDRYLGANWLEYTRNERIKNRVKWMKRTKLKSRMFSLVFILIFNFF